MFLLLTMVMVIGANTTSTVTTTKVAVYAAEATCLAAAARLATPSGGIYPHSDVNARLSVSSACIPVEGRESVFGTGPR